MRDLLSKLDQILLEETTLQDLKREPMAKDPVIAKAIKDKEREEADGDIEESGLQYYIGKKKYGKDGMKKLAQAGRDGASEEELGKIKDQYKKESFEIGDEFGISFTEDFEIGTKIVDLAEDGIVIELDDHAITYLAREGFTFDEGELIEEKQKGLDGKACWKGYRRMGTKMKGGRRVDNCVKVGEDRLQEFRDDDSSDFEVEKEGFENLIIEDRLSGFLNKLARFLVDLGFISTTITSNWSVESVLKAVIEEEDPATAAEARKMLTQFTKFSKTKELGDDLADAMFDVHGDIDDDDPYFYSDINTRHRFNKKKTEPDVEIDRESMEFEAEYQGRKVPLGKPMAGDVKKSKVYVKNPKGNVVKVNFGDKKMRIKKSNPARRKSFRARHNCATAKDRTTARYWSCRAW
jgi:hypothetical protein